MTPDDRARLRRMARGTSFKTMSTGDKIGFGCFVAPIVLVCAFVLYVGLMLILEGDKPDTAQERLEKQLDQGQRDVCDKWGETVEGC